MYIKGVKSQIYTFSKKVWLNNKYIKTKRNGMVESKFFRPFQVLYLIDEEVYKLELLTK